MKLILLSLTLLFTFLTHAHQISPHPPQQQLQQPQFLGAANQSCGAFLNFMQQNDQYTKIAFYSWAQGYASAASAALGKQLFVNAKASLSFIDNEVSQACRANPSLQFGQAVDSTLQQKLGELFVKPPESQ